MGLAGGNDPACRAGFPWDEARWDTGLRSFTRDLTRLRAREATLRRGSIAILGALGGAIVYERRLGERSIVVVVNAGDDTVTLRLDPSGHPSGGPDVLLGGGRVVVRRDAAGALVLDADGRSGVTLGLGES